MWRPSWGPRGGRRALIHAGPRAPAHCATCPRPRYPTQVPVRHTDTSHRVLARPRRSPVLVLPAEQNILQCSRREGQEGTDVRCILRVLWPRSRALPTLREGTRAFNASRRHPKGRAPSAPQREWEAHGLPAAPQGASPACGCASPGRSGPSPVGEQLVPHTAAPPAQPHWLLSTPAQRAAPMLLPSQWLGSVLLRGF